MLVIKTALSQPCAAPGAMGYVDFSARVASYQVVAAIRPRDVNVGRARNAHRIGPKAQVVSHRDAARLVGLDVDFHAGILAEAEHWA